MGKAFGLDGTVQFAHGFIGMIVSELLKNGDSLFRMGSQAEEG